MPLAASSCAIASRALMHVRVTGRGRARGRARGRGKARARGSRALMEAGHRRVASSSSGIASSTW